MKDLIAEKTSGLFVEVGRVIEHMKAQQARIADLERQLAEASAPAVEQPIGHISKGMLEQLRERLGVSGYVQSGRTEEFPVALYTAPQAAEADKVREAIPEGWQVTHMPPWDALTDAAQAAKRISVQRLVAPFCDAAGTRVWSGPTLEDAMQTAHAALKLPYPAAAQAPVREVPEGWQWVPKEPTEAMLEAIEDAAKAECSIEWDSLLGGNLHFGDPSRVYADMLAAAPLPAAPVQKGE